MDKKCAAMEILLDSGYDDVIIISEDVYDKALIGVSTDNCAVYNYDIMVEELMKADGISEEEASDWINYNVVRSLPYAGANPPVIMYPL